MHQRTVLCGGLAAGALLAAGAQGAGFALIEQGASGLGNAFAGGAAVADDPTTVFFNPAGMTRLPGTRGTLAAHLVMPSAELADGRLRTVPAVGPPSPARIGDGGDAGASVVVPNAYLTGQLGERLYAGIGLNAPFGLVTEYDAGWAGRYHAIKSQLRSVNVNPSLAYRVSDRLSLGAGLSAQYVDVELTRSIDSCARLGLPGACDTFSSIEGDDWSFGFNLGLLYSPGEDTRVGVAYRSRVDQDLEGTGHFAFSPNTPPPLAAALRAAGFVDGTGVRAELPLPDSLSLSVHHQVDPRWAVMGDLTWTHWGRLDTVLIRFDSGLTSTLDLHYQNSLRYSLGLDYRASERWTLRGGLAYDEEPVRDAQTRTPRLPGNDRLWLAVGASYRPSPDFTVDLGLAHLFVRDASIDNTVTDATGSYTLTGEYSLHVDIASVQLNWRF
jgi:long-chain fatty acid transport protein